MVRYLLITSLSTFLSLAMAQSQEEMSGDVCEDYRAADAELNATYQAVVKRYQDDPQFLKALKKAQRAWIAFRDAELDALYPAEDKRMEYGSVYPMCECGVLAEMTRSRVMALNLWLPSEEDGEGDVCTGSRRP